MKIVSRWASRHVWLAIFLLIACELSNAFVGLLLGLNRFQNWSLADLTTLFIGVAGGAIWLRMRASIGGRLPYNQERLWLLGAFAGNFFLFIVLGGILNESVQHPSANTGAWGNRRVVMRADTLEQPDRRATTTPSPTTNDYYAEQAARMDRPRSQRAGFVLLFLIGIVLSVVATILACNLACANYGIAAALVFIVGLGTQAGGIFFLSRAFERVIKPWREMDHTDRRRINRRFLRIWLGFWVAFFLLTLANSR